MGCIAIILSGVILIGGIVPAFASGNWGLAIVLIGVLIGIWWIAGMLHNRALVAQGIRGEIGTRAIQRTPEWERAFEAGEYSRAASVTRAMVAEARQSKLFEGDRVTFAALSTLHIGTLHLAGEVTERSSATNELLKLFPPGEVAQMRADLDEILSLPRAELVRELLTFRRDVLP